jgi:hypothetical protein
MRGVKWIAAGLVAAAGGFLLVGCGGRGTSAAASGSSGQFRTPWGEADLQGIWTLETDTPLQRPAKFKDKSTLTDAERAELDKQRAALLGRDKRVERGTELDVAGAYSAVFNTVKRTGPRTSLIVDPPNGRIPPLTPEAQARAAGDRAFRLSLLQSTDTCKNHMAGCNGGKYDPSPSGRLNEIPDRYNTGRMNRHDRPEDGSVGDRCFVGALPDMPTPFGGNFQRIVQTPGGIAIFYDTGQGQGFRRNIVMNGSPHLSPSIRQFSGDSRGRWEGSTLVIDVTNFTPMLDSFGSRENKHLVERYTRTGPNTLEYKITIEDPTVFTRPWTIQMDFGKQATPSTASTTRPRCHEGNYAFPSLMLAARPRRKRLRGPAWPPSGYEGQRDRLRPEPKRTRSTNETASMNLRQVGSMVTVAVAAASVTAVVMLSSPGHPGSRQPETQKPTQARGLRASTASRA